MNEARERVDEDRKYEIEACIVRFVDVFLCGCDVESVSFQDYDGLGSS